MNARVLDQSVVLRRRVAHLPLLRQFWEEVESRITDDSDSFWECEELLANLVRSSMLEEFLAHELSLVAQHDGHAAPDSTPVSLQLLSNDRWTLGVHLHSPRAAAAPRAIQAPAEHIMSTMVRGSITFRCYRIPGGPAGNTVFRRDVRLEPVGDTALVPGRVVKMRAGLDAHYVVAPTSEAISLNLMLFNATPLRWFFDGSDLLARKASAGCLTHKRIEFAMRVLAMMPTAESVDTLEKLALHHPAHFVRWAAIREVARIDGLRAKRLLEAATADLHPHVRNAARKGLDRIQKREQNDTEGGIHGAHS